MIKTTEDFKRELMTLKPLVQNMTTITGTPKQIDWATKIRMDLIQEARQQIFAVAKDFNASDAQASFNFNKLLLTTESAKWFIDNREMFTTEGTMTEARFNQLVSEGQL